MNRITVVILIAFFSCNNDDDSGNNPPNNLKKRIATYETDYPNAPSIYTKDSVVEYIENKKIISREFHQRFRYDNPIKRQYSLYEYDQNNYLKEIKYYTDIDFTNHYATLTYNYSGSNEIVSRVYNRFAPSNFSSSLSHETIHYEYILDTIKEYSIDHLNNDYREDLKTYITYGNLDSINSNNDFMHIFDNQNDLIAANCLGNNYNCDETYNGLYTYGESKESLVDNPYGNNYINMFLLGSPTYLGYWEYFNKYIDVVGSVYPTDGRNSSYRHYNYIFDDDNRLIESFTSSISSTTRRVRYYYE